MTRRALDRLLLVIARFATEGFFRSVEVEGRSLVPPPGTPCLVVANHFNGFVDPVLVVRGIGRMPRFLAKATLWRVWPARPLYALAGLIPVHRRIDAGLSAASPGENLNAFRSAHDALRNGQIVAIFPEGTTHDEPRLAEMRTGAARIALGAAEQGIVGLQILPVGLVVEDKLETRSRALVRVGRPIGLDVLNPELNEASPGTDDDQTAVRALTAQIAEGIRAVSPDFESLRHHGALTLAAEIASRQPGRDASGEVALGERERLAKRMGQLPDNTREAIRAAVADYHLDLALLGVSDGELVAGQNRRQLAVRLVRSALLLLIVSPLVIVGVVVNLIPTAAVVAAGRRAAAPVSKGTARILTGLATFPAMWWLIAFVAVDGWLRVMGVMVLLALIGLITALAAEGASDAVRDYRGWRTVVHRRAILGPARDHRAELVRSIEQLVGPVDADTVTT